LQGSVQRQQGGAKGKTIHDRARESRHGDSIRSKESFASKWAEKTLSVKVMLAPTNRSDASPRSRIIAWF
jgi:hypothetical protein